MLPDFENDIYPDYYIRQILKACRTIALVGASKNPARPSNMVMSFLQAQGYRVIPVNPGLAGQNLHGEQVYDSLSGLPCRIDMVDIFRKSEQAGIIADRGIKIGAKAVWMQLNVIDPAAAGRALNAGLKVVMNRCPAIEIRRLNLAKPAHHPITDIKDKPGHEIGPQIKKQTDI